MNLDDALKCLAESFQPGMTVECWMLGNGQLMRRVRLDDSDTEFYCANDEQLSMAINAVAQLLTLAGSMDEWTRRFPNSVRSNKSIQNQQEAELAEGESVMTGVF